MEPIHSDYIAADVRNQTAQEQQEFNLMAQLKPSIQKDGDQWCVLYGDNLQEGIAGFGSSPYLAIIDFNAQWYRTIETKEGAEIFPGTKEALDDLSIQRNPINNGE